MTSQVLTLSAIIDSQLDERHLLHSDLNISPDAEACSLIGFENLFTDNVDTALKEAAANGGAPFYTEDGWICDDTIYGNAGYQNILFDGWGHNALYNNYGEASVDSNIWFSGDENNDVAIIVKGEFNRNINDDNQYYTWIGTELAEINQGKKGYLNVFYGEGGDDRLHGDAQDDFLNGGADNDYLYGYDGNDVLEGGSGEDNIFGGNGLDVISGGTGNDVIRGENNNDMITGGDGEDKLYGDDGNDEIYGGNHNDVLYGGSGVDTLDGGDGEDILYGNDHTDYLSGGNGNDYLFGGHGQDLLIGDDGDDHLYGEQHEDYLIGSKGNDTLYGGEGNDFLSGGEGNDFLRGGTGNDIFSFYTSLNPHSNVDTIDDFEVGIDKIELNKNIFTGLDLHFKFTAGPYAVGSGSQIIYDKDTGFLSYDPDGAGGIDQTNFAFIRIPIPLSANDFFVI